MAVRSYTPIMLAMALNRVVCPSSHIIIYPPYDHPMAPILPLSTYGSLLSESATAMTSSNGFPFQSFEIDSVNA